VGKRIKMGRVVLIHLLGIYPLVDMPLIESDRGRFIEVTDTEN
jgi:hypothetical protein